MRSITKQLRLETSPNHAFQKFVFEINQWWPKQYTWSQEKLVTISIEAKKDGLCTEIGPYGFRCDWGRVTAIVDHELIALKWQIGANREPIPDPDKSSDLIIKFLIENGHTTVQLEHLNFINHGNDAEKYLGMMNSEYGWDYILGCYKAYCEKP